MKLLAVFVLLAGVCGMVTAQSCLENCNNQMISCLSGCQQQCPTDPNCMKNCYGDCTTQEQQCVQACGPPPTFRAHAPKKATPNCPCDCSSPNRSLICINCCDGQAAPVVQKQMTEQDYQTEFTTFVKKYAKKYTHDEFFARYNIFKANYNLIRHHNMNAKASFSMSVNEFADMTQSEFKAKMTGYKRIDNSFHRSKNGPHRQVKAPAASVDWRAKGAVTPVKNQQQCGSCWAFSTTGSTEGAHAIATGNLVSLSEQQLVDCSGAQGNQGCNGGLMDQAFQYIISNGGITSESQYPYTAQDGTCNTNVTSVTKITGFTDVATNSDPALMAAVNIGPVSVAIEADQPCFQFYSGGVLDDATCGTQLDHGVLVVGYGTDSASGKDFWIVKNSWGETWGESGYVRIVRGKDMCGINTEPSYPTGASEF